jgi:hypothetical protein
VQQTTFAGCMIYLITSSAHASRVGGTVRYCTLAILRLMCSVHLAGCSTEMSTGFVARRFLATNSASWTDQYLATIGIGPLNS